MNNDSQPGVKNMENYYIDLWYGNKIEEVTKIDISFYDNEICYRGNIYKNDKIIGDYWCKDSLLLEKLFPHLTFNWN